MAHIDRDVFKDRNPYLNAPRAGVIGTKSCNWMHEDRILARCCEVVEVLIYILLLAGVVYLVV